MVTIFKGMLMLGRMIAGILIAVGLCGCTTKGRSVPATPEIDGILDDPAWEQVPSRPLLQPRDWVDAGRILMENGTVRFFHADGILYLAAEFKDSFLITAGEKDGDDLYHGDCCEIFIKPAGESFYWEVWISPDALRSVATWRKKGDLESQGRLLAGQEIRVATTIQGTLNNEMADDAGWGLEAALPFPDVPGLEQAAWEILIARQNYDETLSKETRELSSFPRLSKASFHLTEEYLDLRDTALLEGIHRDDNGQTW